MPRPTGLFVINALGATPSVWRSWRRFTQYHGVWTLGIRFLRDLTLARKSLVLAACLAVPVAIGMADLIDRRLDELRALETAHSKAHLFAQIAHVSHQLLNVSQAATPSQRASAALEQERAFARLADLVATAGTLEPAQARSWNALRAASSTPPRTLQDIGGPAADQAIESKRVAIGQFQRDLEVDDTTAARQTDLPAMQRGLGADLSRLVAVVSTLADSSSRLGTAEPRRMLADVLEARLRLERILAELDGTRAGAALLADLGGGFPRSAQAYLHQRERLMLAGAPEAVSDADDAAMTLAGRLAASDALRFQESSLEALSARLDLQLEDARRRALRDALLGSICALACAYLLVCMYKVMRGGLEALCRHLVLVGSGNLAREPVGLGKDEIGQALSSLGLSVRGMAALFSVVNQGVAAVSHAAREVAAGNAGLAVRTEEIRRDISDVSHQARDFSGAMSECGALVDKAAEHVRVVRNETQRSRRAMSELRDRMRSLQRKSQEITKIVSLMEATAYQTKLLSLNASVEASRAGEAGKGFSIVAAEVRGLAQRSHDAAQRIRDIVGASIEHIEDGNVMTDRASAGVQTTFEVTEAVDEVMRDIVRLTQASLADSREMRTKARQVEEAVDGNARVVAQLSEASAALRLEGDKLKRSVHAFVFE